MLLQIQQDFEEPVVLGCSRDSDVVEEDRKLSQVDSVGYLGPKSEYRI